MCGRYTLTRQQGVIEDLQASLEVSVAQSAWWKPRFNVAPTQPAPVVTLHEGRRTIEMMRWGLVPFWARAESIDVGPQRSKDRHHLTARAPLAGAGAEGKRAPLMINARVETLPTKPVFRDALARRRCLVPADGFFEWKRTDLPPGTKKPLPIYLHPASGKVIAFAGLWDKAKTAAGELLSFTIVTCPANELVKPIHDRMPVVLDPSAYAAWLDPTLDADRARALLEVPPLNDWRGEPVSTWVNSAQHDDPACIERVAPESAAQRSLF